MLYDGQTGGAAGEPAVRAGRAAGGPAGDPAAGEPAARRVGRGGDGRQVRQINNNVNFLTKNSPEPDQARESFG